MSHSFVPLPGNWSVRQAMEKDIPLFSSLVARIISGSKDIQNELVAKMDAELEDGHAVVILKGKREMCWVGYSVGETIGQYYLELTYAPILTTKVITPLVDLWRTILDHFVITVGARIIRVNIDKEDLDQIDLLNNLGFKPASPTSDAPDYHRRHGNLSDPAPALVCTRQDYLDSRDRKYYENT